MCKREYVPLTGQEADARTTPPARVAAMDELATFRRLLADCDQKHADLARRVWQVYEADDSDCRLPREYIALFQRVLGESPYKLRLARELIGSLLQKAGVL